MLQLDDLTLAQGDFRLTADIALKEGRATALIGASGSGKSTLLNAVAGFLPPVSGRILWRGADVTGLPPARRDMAMLFQDNNLFPHLTAAQNVALGVRPDLKLSAADWARVTEGLAAVGLADMGQRRPAALSGGQQSRVALARVLVSGRQIVLLDEPFAALGPALKDEMLNLVAARLLADGRTILMVTHHPDDARRIAQETVVIADGRAHQPVGTRELLDNPPLALAAYLGR